MIIIQKRFEFVDHAKAWGMILICLGHFLRNGLAVKTALYCFHVPVFFVIAGFLFKSHGIRPLPYIGKTAKRVLLPYCGWFALAALRYLPALSRKRIQSLVVDFFMLDGLPIWNQPLWFVPVFFTALSVFAVVIYALGKLDQRKRNGCVGILALLCFAVAAVCDYLAITEVPFGLNKSVMMLGYVCIGYLLRRVFDRKQIMNRTDAEKKKLAVVSLVVFTLFFVVAAVVNRGDNISVMSCDFNNIGLYIPLSIVGSCTFLLLFLPLKQNRWASLISSSTLFLMGSHYFLRFWWRNTMPETLLLDILGGTLAIVILVGICAFWNHLAKTGREKWTLPAKWLGFGPTRK